MLTLNFQPFSSIIRTLVFSESINEQPTLSDISFYNPSALSIWIEVNGLAILIKSSDIKKSYLALKITFYFETAPLKYNIYLIIQFLL